MTEEHSDQDAAGDTAKHETPAAAPKKKSSTPAAAPKKKSNKVLAVYPGHVVNMSLAEEPDPAHPTKPFLVTAEYARQGYNKRFATKSEAEAFIEETQTESERGFKDSDRSLWD